MHDEWLWYLWMRVKFPCTLCAGLGGFDIAGELSVCTECLGQGFLPIGELEILRAYVVSEEKKRKCH
jgi:hypothetical protein